MATTSRMKRRIVCALILAGLAWLLLQTGPTAPQLPPAPPEREVAAGPASPLPLVDQAEASPPALVECDLIPVVVFDFADAEPLPDVRFSLVYTAEESPCQWPTEATSDRSGRIMVCPKHLSSLLPEEPWLLPNVSVESVLAEGELWVYRMVEVIGQVTVGGDPAKAKLERTNLSALVLADPNAATSASKHLDTLALAKQGLDHVGNLTRPDAEGNFRVEVPAVKGMTMRAGGLDSRMATAELDIPDDPREPARVRLELEDPPYVVSGVVRDASGRRIGKVELTLHLVQDIPIEEVPNMAKHRRVGHAYTAAGRKDQTGYVDFHAWDNSENRGKNIGAYEIRALTGGRATLVVMPPEGYRPQVLELGNLTDNHEGLDIVLEEYVEGPGLRVLRNGSPLFEFEVYFSDLSLGDVQEGFRKTTNTKGEVPTHLFFAGHRYMVISLKGKFRAGWFVYRGQEQIDIAKDLRSVSDL
jgi:hypothetical protein